MGQALIFQTADKRRNRILYAILLVLVIAVGLFSRSSLAVYMPFFFSEYAGDTLWALTVFLTFCFIFPSVNTFAAGLVALLISFGVETLQLYQAPWMNVLRDTIPGKLLLGSGFKWSDFLCYSIGILSGVTGEFFAFRHTSKRR